MRNIVERRLKANWAMVGWPGVVLAMASGVVAQDKQPLRLTPPASVALQTGKDYLTMCGTERGRDAVSIDGAACYSYTWGLYSGLATTQRMFAGPEQAPMVCVPETVGMGELMRISLKWLQENPTSLHEPLAEMMIVSWFKSFPCPKGP